MTTIDKFIQIDIKTLEKINTIPNCFDKLEAALVLFNKFKIQDEITFYHYIQTNTFNDTFDNITYNDIQAFIRLKNNPNHYLKVQQEYDKKNQKTAKIIQLYPKKDKE